VPQVELLEKLLSPIFHLRQEDDENSDFEEAVEDAFEDAGEAIADAFDDAGNALAPHTKPKNQNDLDENELFAMIAEILIGFGIMCELVGTFFLFTAWNSITGFVLALGSTGLYVWAVLKYVDAINEPTAATAFRSWQINYIMFWAALIVSLIYVGISFATISSIWMIIAGFVGLAAQAAGVVLGYRIKNIWFHYDPTGSQAEKDFDYFKWSDRETEGSKINEEINEAFEEAGEDIEEAFEGEERLIADF